jgi:deazaflavin-dependent oxidoreductase (nitroreductase family)
MDRTRNPFLNSPTGGRVLSALQLPLFMTRPPAGYGVLTTRGRKSGKKRRRCVRVVKRGDRAYLVAIKGPRTAWLKNVRADPRVQLRIRAGRLSGTAREADGSERQVALEAYSELTSPWFEHLEYRMWRQGKPSAAGIGALHRTWFETGTPLVVELDARRDNSD